MKNEYEMALNEKLIIITQLEKEITAVMKERLELSQQADALKSVLEQVELAQTHASANSPKGGSLVEELNLHHSAIVDMQIDFQRTKDGMDHFHVEKVRQDLALKELQAQLAASDVHNGNESNDHQTPATTIPTPSATQNTIKLSTQLEDALHQIEDQDTVIKTLNKQLTHCERDLQAHMDLVETLEISLCDSERNRTYSLTCHYNFIITIFTVRKSRLHATELVRERDNLQPRVGKCTK